MPERQPVASLPMYDWPEVQWAHDALWAAIAARLNEAGIPAPAALDRVRPSEEVWRDPSLVLSQTCGWPYVTRLSSHVHMLGTPVYAVEGCNGPFYSSAIVVRREHAGKDLHAFRGERFAYNSDDSLSGYVAPRAELRVRGLDPQTFDWTETGSHRNSIRAVASGTADIASIDAVCWALAREHEAESAAALAVLAWTPPRPGLPFVSAGSKDERSLSKLRAAIDAAVAAPETAWPRSALRLSGWTELQESEYAPMRGLA